MEFLKVFLTIFKSCVFVLRSEIINNSRSSDRGGDSIVMHRDIKPVIVIVS